MVKTSNNKKYIELLENKNNFLFKKISHEVKYSIDGICPHCNIEIKTEKIEKFSDNIKEPYKKYELFLNK